MTKRLVRLALLMAYIGIMGALLGTVYGEYARVTGGRGFMDLRAGMSDAWVRLGR